MDICFVFVQVVHVSYMCFFLHMSQNKKYIHLYFVNTKEWIKGREVGLTGTAISRSSALVTER